MGRRDFIGRRWCGRVTDRCARPAAQAGDRLPRVPLSRKLFAERLEAFRQGLDEAGFHQDRNVRVEDRWAGGDVS